MSHVQIPPGFGSDAALKPTNWTKATLIGFPINGDTTEGVKATYLRAACDGGKARFRVAMRGDGKVNWTIHDIAVDAAAGIVTIAVPAGVGFASILRAPFTALDTVDNVPAAFWSWSSAA
jgi:hypothetical protein